MTTQSNKNLCDYVMKSDISENHERIIRNLFNALFVEQQEGHVIDHTPNISDIMTLDLNQIQWLLIKRREGDYSQDDILDALKGLEFPKLLFNGTISTYSDFNGKQINAIRLDYGQVAETSPLHVSETDKLAEELSQVNFIESAATSSKWETDAKAWKNKAFKLYEQQTIDRDTIQSLRAVIIDMAETLHVADPDARINMTSSDLLDLINSQNDMSDNAF